ncbi:MAG: peptide-methionine (S)-S-oxide reductase MsrA [Dehalococcoidales bacterium]|nr:peptide-methionine (S)-S-oxide reductase MsrA [Dehalococcoidales bacterium]
MPKEEIATLAGGCFWCMETIFKEVHGVQQVISGYTGGHKEKPTYEQVCSDNTGHAEAIQVTFFPDELSFRDILEIFFTVHDPTTLNRQGNDVGSQYRSAIFYHNEAQKEIAEKVIADMTKQKLYPNPIVTQIKPFKIFYSAEDYHRDYFEQHPENTYCQIVISPKLKKFRQKWAMKLKK